MTRHYVDALTKADARELDCHISVKLTQLGLDVDEARCLAQSALARCAVRMQHNTFVWIDMEQHGYVDATLQAYRRALC